MIPFKEISKLEVDPKIEYSEKIDRHYPFLFKLTLAKRDLVLGAKTITERAMWLNGFNVLFEFREYQNRKLQHVITIG